SVEPKRLKATSFSSSKDKKENLTARIAALQQLVSPYGKTDTASVLLEALEYITFLHEQVKVLSAPYLRTAPWRSPNDDEEKCGLKSKGLCLVPLSFTLGVANSNGADIWAPVKNSPMKS
ncbi:hypothetical protein M569_05974, partial [Genlisea aurea]